MNHKEHEEHEEEARKGEHYEPLTAEVEAAVRDVIGAGIAVHSALGPGFIEGVYDRALVIELHHRGRRAERQKAIEIRYRGELVCRHRLDLIVEGVIVVEVKAVRRLRPIQQAQLLSYLKASGCRVGLLMNFNVRRCVNGLQRLIR
jgi:GxxExxY protein